MNLTTKRMNLCRALFSSAALTSMLGVMILSASNPARAEPIKFQSSYSQNSISNPNLTDAAGFSAPIKQANAYTFAEQQVDQERFVAVAVPFGYKQYSLAIIEQVSKQRNCWQELGNSPVTVEPLLLTFDFTGICRRATDSNGYSVRINGQDRSNYMVNIAERNGELHLLATHPDPNQPEVLIGRSYGLDHDKKLIKIFLNPGWYFSKRLYQSQTLGHFYLSYQS